MNVSNLRLFFLFVPLLFHGQLSNAQAIHSDGMNRLQPHFSLLGGSYRFKGDQAISPYSSGNFIYGAALGMDYSSWKISAHYTQGTILWNNQWDLGRSNFQSRLNDAGILLGRYLLNKDFSPMLRPYAMLGVSLVKFETYTDRLDENNVAYQFWSDGSIRNLPETHDNLSTSKIITRDYSYETPIAIQQKSICFPVEIGLSAPLSDRVSADVSWKYLFMQSDNVDRNTETKQWDNIQQISIRLNVSLNRMHSKSSPKNPSKNSLVDYSDVDFKSLWYTDEDGDGVNDLNDRCYATPKGAPVNKYGCTADTDADGVYDFNDQQPTTALYSWVNETGVAFDDAWIKEHYSDSSSYFVQVLRKVNRNSRPYPVRKYIPETSYQRWNMLLEEHPEWRTTLRSANQQLPAELIPIDSNHDMFISISELEQAANDLFDGRNNMTKDKLQKAIEYAFRNQ
ncbi:MAG: hypothetical protein RLZZ543_1249 [Bacteroidota bacterium]|jgi:opacity protein-like surface antigen